MRWQRARVVLADPEAHGALIWVQTPPQCAPRECLTRAGRWVPAGEMQYLTNIECAPPPGFDLAAEFYITTDAVELLAEFCEDPPRIAWGAWERDGRATES